MRGSGAMLDKSLNERMGLELDLNVLMMHGVMSPLRIKKIRKKYGLTQADFADMLSIAYATYCSWEKGVRRPSSPSCALLQIAEKHPAIFLQNRKELVEGIMKYFGKKRT